MLSGGCWGLKWKVELDVDELVQQKWVKLVVEAGGMRLELTMWEALLE